MKIKRLIVYSILFSLILEIISPISAFAFDAKTTHPAITKKAISVNKVEHNGNTVFLKEMKRFGSAITTGSIDEDYPDNLRRFTNTTPGLGFIIPALNHFYNPMFGDWGYLPFNVSAPETAQDLNKHPAKPL